MEIRQLACFVRIVDAGSFSRAATSLMLAQATLSRTIALLEQELGQRLLVRTGRGVVPTEAGQLLLSHAQAILQRADAAREALRDMEGSPRGRVVVGLPPRVAQSETIALVEGFRSRFPQAVITVAEGLSVHLREWLVAGRIDLALLFDPPPTPQLQLEVLARERFFLVMPTASQRPPARVSLTRLARFPMVLPSSPNAIRSLLDRALEREGITLTVVAEVNTVQATLALVEHGVGCTVLPESALPATAEQRAVLRVAAIGPPAIRNTLVLANPISGPATRLTRATADLLREIGARLQRATGQKAHSDQGGRPADHAAPLH